LSNRSSFTGRSHRGIGFINPAGHDPRSAFGAALTEAPTAAWHVKNA
jgi:hypothetical protein